MSSIVQRVVVTGMGLVSSVGCTVDAAWRALCEARSGVVAAPELERAGLKCQVLAPVSGWDKQRVPRSIRKTASPAAMYASVAAIDAVADAGLDLANEDTRRAAIVVGSEFGGISETSRMHRLLSAKKKTRAGATGVAKFMNSTAAANLAVQFRLRGRAYSASSSFASGTDCIGQGYELIKDGVADIVICGAAEEECWFELAPYFENLGLLAVGSKESPHKACQPYDVDRQGMVMSAGAGIVVLESLKHMQARGQRPYAEVVGYGATNDGHDVFKPSGDGLARALAEALAEARSRGVASIDYVNTHGTGTRVGDLVESTTLYEIVGEGPLVSSTKSLTGHSLGAAGAVEAVLTLLMMRDGVVIPTLNLNNLDSQCGKLRYARALVQVELATAVSFNVGLGGTNSALVLRRPE